MTGALITTGVVLEVQLVILLSGPPLAGGRDLGDDASLPPLGIGFCRDVARNLLLLGVVEVDGGAVLGASVGALGVEGRGVVHGVEELEELCVRDLGGVKDDLSSLSVCRQLEINLAKEGERDVRPVLPPQTAR